MRTLIPPRKQTVWGWPAVVNFSLGGLGSGLYLLWSLLAAARGGAAGGALVQLAGPALAGLGLAALTAEAGHPLRGHNLLRHLRRSWMSREALFGGLFMAAAALNWLAPNPGLHGLAVAAAAALLISQGLIVCRARGVPAWNVPIMPVLFLTCGLATGAGLALALSGAGLLARGTDLVWAGLTAASLNLVVWLLYVYRPEADFQQVTGALRTPRSHALIVVMGHLFPVALLAGLPGAAAPVWTLAGVCLLLGGVLQKTGIILAAGYLRAIRLGAGRTELRPAQTNMVPHRVGGSPLS